MSEHLHELVLSYQAGPAPGVLTEILSAMRPGIRKWGRDEDERQLATIAVWKCALSWKPDGLGFAHYCKIVARRTIQAHRNELAAVPVPIPKAIAERQANRAAWKEYTISGGTVPAVSAPGNIEYDDTWCASRECAAESHVLIKEVLAQSPDLADIASETPMYPKLSRQGASLRKLALLGKTKQWALAEHKNCHPGTAE